MSPSESYHISLSSRLSEAQAHAIEKALHQGQFLDVDQAGNLYARDKKSTDRSGPASDAALKALDLLKIQPKTSSERKELFLSADRFEKFQQIFGTNKVSAAVRSFFSRPEIASPLYEAHCISTEAARRAIVKNAEVNFGYTVRKTKDAMADEKAEVQTCTTELAAKTTSELESLIKQATIKVVVAPAVMKLSSSAELIQGMAKGLVGFVQEHMVASNRGHRLLEALDPSSRKQMERLVVLEKEISKTTDSAKLKNLKAEEASLRRELTALRQELEKDRVGDFFPTAQSHTIEAMHAYFSGLSRAVVALKAENPLFEEYPSELKGMLIGEKIKAMQDKGDANVSAIPIFMPSEEDLKEKDIDLLFIHSYCKNKHNLPALKEQQAELKETLQEKENLLADLERTGPQRGWIEGLLTQDRSLERLETLREEVQSLREDVAFIEEELTEKEEALATDLSKFEKMNKDLGAVMAKGSKAKELEFLSRTTDALINHVLFPEGIHLGSIPQFLIDAANKLKKEKIEVDQASRGALNEFLLSYIDYYSTPKFINQQLEPMISRRLAALEESEGDSERVKELPKGPSDGELVEALLRQKEKKVLSARETEQYKNLALDILSLGAPGTSAALKKLESWVGSFGVAESGHRLISDIVEATAMSFGNRELSKGLTATTGVLNFTQPWIEPEDDEVKTREEVRRGIATLTSTHVASTVDSLTRGWLGVIPGARSVIDPIEEYSRSGVLELYDITQIEGVTRTLMCLAVGAIGDSIEAVASH